MDIRERYQKFVQKEIRENANPYPTSVQSFNAGVESERERIIALLEGDIAICKEFDHEDNTADSKACCDEVRHCIGLIKGEIE